MSGKTRRGLGLAALAWLAFSPASAFGDDARQESGRILSERLCAGCHATGLTGASPFEAAPPFRSLADRYEIGTLEEALAEGIEVGHPAMPVFEFAPEEIGDLIAYIESLGHSTLP